MQHEARKVTIEIIPHFSQRYNTCGDWQFDANGNLTIRVSDMPGQGTKGSMAVAVHELVEALLCEERGITTEMVDEFDLHFNPLSDIEPGDHPECPCRREHSIATGIERIFVDAIGLEWCHYEAELEAMTEAYEEYNK